MTFPDWPVLGLELAQRAAEYGKIASPEEMASHKKTSADLLEYQKLDVPNKANESSPWWWVYVPLLKALLEESKDGDSLATWVTVGHYYWDHEEAIPVRHWVTFLSQKSPIDEKNEPFKKALNTLKTAVVPGPDQAIMTSAQLLDEMNQCEHTEHTPTLYPLLICFDVPPELKEEKIPLMVADWQIFRKKINQNPKQDIGGFSPLSNEQSTIKGTHDVSKHASGNGEETTIENQLRAFISWLHTMPESESWCRMLTIPAWLLDHHSSMHSGGIIVYVRSEKWLCDIDNEKLISEIGSFTGAFRSGSMVLISEEAEEQKALRLLTEKQAQMLKLLKEPLDNLTKALAKTQQDTQTLQSILYDPHKVLFAVSPLVEKYFSTDEACKYGKVQWKGMHTIDGVTSQNGGRDAAVMLAAIICRIYGREPEESDDELMLYRVVKESLTSDNPAFSDLRSALASLVQDGGLGKVVEQLGEQLVGVSGDSEVAEITALLNRLKAVIFTPFKFSGAMPWLPLVLILSDFGYTDEVTMTNASNPTNRLDGTNKYSLKKILAENSIFSFDLFPEDALLALRYSDILSLISGVLGFMQDEGFKIESVIVKRGFSKDNLVVGVLSIKFNEGLFVLSQLPDTFRLMETASKKRMRMIQGNFRKPFIDFAIAVQGGDIDIMNDIEKSGKRKGKKIARAKQMRWVVTNGGAKIVLCLEADCFCLELGVDSGKGGAGK